MSNGNEINECIPQVSDVWNEKYWNLSFMWFGLSCWHKQTELKYYILSEYAEEKV